ncbi:MAG TPA: hypothetical protein VFJ26_15585, partial [Dyella sp.]|nr:hypothetical protein [Dyella sp.]
MISRPVDRHARLPHLPQRLLQHLGVTACILPMPQRRYDHVLARTCMVSRQAAQHPPRPQLQQHPPPAFAQH